jgi:hypothetical protein
MREQTDYRARVDAYIAQGMTNSDAQSVVDAEDMSEKVAPLAETMRKAADSLANAVEEKLSTAGGLLEIYESMGDDKRLFFTSLAEIFKVRHEAIELVDGVIELRASLEWYALNITSANQTQH